MTQLERSDWLRSENFTYIMIEYEIDPVSIVEDTGSVHRQRWMDKLKPVYLPFNFIEAGGYNYGVCNKTLKK